ncbi:MAG TPA: oxidoreductase [Pseudonocardia sp.]|jgi:hypothetical protein|uniref:oxidoreductase n=1 Tax=Pseudonocardia sp. TaxID=60912 RepID=UPI002F3FE9F6
MGLLKKVRNRSIGIRRDRGEDIDHLCDWAARRTGVEAFVEPETMLTQLTVLLVDAEGAWTRRRVSGPGSARKLGRDLRMPVYDVLKVGYPRRMRDHDARQRILRERARRRDLEN